MIPPTYFDLESAALPLDVLETRMPVFEAPSTYKDPEKIEAAIEAKRQEWLDGAALSPLTGQILVIGLLSDGKTDFLEGDEKTLLAAFWERADAILSVYGNLIGFNCVAFDLPFLVKRSYAHGVHVPRIIGGWNKRYWNWNADILDLRLLWQMGDRQAHGSLDVISRFLGLAGKTGSGKDFAKLYAEDREKALEYLARDVALTEAVYLKLQL